MKRRGVIPASVLIGLTIGALVSSGPASPLSAQEHGGGHGRHGGGKQHGEGGQIDPAEMFRSRCVSCHLAPDPARVTDQAWLHQVNETA